MGLRQRRRGKKEKGLAHPSFDVMRLALPLSAYALPGLLSISFKNGGNHLAEARTDFIAARGVVHLYAAPFASNQSSLSQDLEMLGERSFGNVSIVNLQKAGACLRGLRLPDARKYPDTYRVRKRIENSLYRNLFD